MGSLEDSLRRRILLRRAALVSAALSSGLGGVEACSSPQPCLEPFEPDAGTTEAGTDGSSLDAPQPCLTMMPPDAGDDAGLDSSADASDATKG